MAGYQPYPEHKESGVEWLGEVPRHWDVKRVKNIATYNDEALDEKTDPDFELEYVDISSVNLVDGITSTEVTSFEKSPSRARRKVIDGDTIVSTVRTYLKAIAAIRKPPENLIVSTGFAVIRPKPEIDSDYLGYLLQSEGFVGDVVANSVGVSYPAINASILAALPAVQPSMKEQQTIARFLDYKTAQIDALIAKKQTLLEKLAEKRTALISHAVTKGLDPNVKMKDSGVEWLGEVPEHWGVTQFSHFIYFQEGPGIMASDFTDDGVPLLRISNLKPGFVDVEGCNFVSPQKVADKWSHFKLDIGDLLISSSASTGLVSIVADSAVGSIPYTGIIRLRPFNGLIVSDYIRTLVGSELFFAQISMLKTGTTIQHYGPAHLRQMRITLPPVDEQIRIANYVDMINVNIARMQNKVFVAIEKLKEYRSALITQAVTGKIDVRNVKISETSAKGHAA
jgi:type I restriction enzyme S subunit